ncbi:E3 ubiquitin-protein ligase RHF2A -like protein [Gossypium arboreum]|uniref:E3 ubiquitin-protein ligase RHF2A-like protein n=1 Tax=Gossypium arboreum TaxID=29729 RepID=A0A0B0M9X2_GOSAR|nr:E3 ubiquitin-protein ligase RHF2A -like protein [Gossypium arboreum]
MEVPDLRQHATLKLPTLPKTLEAVISQEKFEKSRAYSLDKRLKSGTFLPLLGLIEENEILHTLSFLAGAMIWSQITDLPFSLYSTFVIEARHGFNKLPVGVNDAELEERIIQHLAAAAAMGRAHHISRREALRNRSSAQGRRPQYLVFSHSNDEPSSTGPISSLSPTQSEGEPASPITVGSPSFPARTAGEESPASITLPSVQADQQPASASSSSILLVNDRGNSSNTRTSPNSQDSAGPSEFQSFSESLKSRFNAVSTRYKESISRSTRGWKERFFSRNTSMADIGSEVRREVNAGIATVSRMMERLETRDNGTNPPTVTTSLENSSNQEPNRCQISDTSEEAPLPDISAEASRASSSASK